MRRDPVLPHVVLIGGGHSHVQVLRRHRERPFPARLSIVLDHPESVYSGMVPGFVAGQYSAADLTIDVWALARTAGVRVVDGAALAVDPDRGRVEIAGRSPVAFDTLSIDIGSTVAGLDLPGVREFALSTRPIGRFVAQVDERLARAADPALPIVVVGAGAAGFELAYCLNVRTGRPVVVVSEASLARPATPGRAVAFRTARVSAVTARGAVLDGGEEVAASLVVWATGAAALPLASRSGLPCVAGYVEVEPTLQVKGLPAIFAVGDCAHVPDGRGGFVPKAGVYAVREGPVLCDNLEARLLGSQPRPYRPQRDFLSLLNLGDGTAIGRRSGLTARGAWVWRQKDRIDRRFMAMFQVLDARDRPVAMGLPETMADEMECGGCAAKIGPAELEHALRGLPAVPPDPSVMVGLAQADDAALVIAPSGDVLGLSVDAFTAFCDDPFVVGRVAAVNAVNDLYVKGVTPRWAMATVAIPDLPGALDELMAGVRSGLDPLGVSLVGGHSMRCDELCVGLAVTGVADAAGPGPEPEQGHALVLTRGLGAGVLLRANAMGRARGEWVREVMRWMGRSHREAAAVVRQCGAGALTDVTGFGFYGHLLAMLRRTRGLGADVVVAELPLYPGVASLFAQGVRSTFHGQNLRGVPVSGAGLQHPLAEVGFDPQTAGPLLFTIPAHQVDAVLFALAAVGEPARRVGTLTALSGVRLV